MLKRIVVPVVKAPSPPAERMKVFPEDSKKFVIARLSEILTLLEQIQIHCETGSVEGIRMAVLYRWGPIGISEGQLVSFCIRMFYELANEFSEESLLRS